MSFLRKQMGFVLPAIPIIILLVALPVLLILSQSTTVFKPKAQETPPVNLLRNGSFEVASPSARLVSWTCEDSLGLVRPETAGAYPCQQDTTVAVAPAELRSRYRAGSAKIVNPQGAAFQLTQTINDTFNQGETLCLRVFRKIRTYGDQLTVGIRSVAAPRQEKVFRFTGPGTDWNWDEQNIYLNDSIISPRQGAQFKIYLRSDTGGGAGWFDHVTLTRGQCEFTPAGSIVEPSISANPSPTPSSSPSQRTYTVSGIVFEDLNRNRSRSSSEQALSNMSVELTNQANYPNGQVFSTTTGSDGRYSFQNLPAGSYRLDLTVPAEYELTTANNGFFITYPLPSARNDGSISDWIIDFGLLPR
ncbi:MAG: hypothetical protein G01um10147_715 [Microgenomates group bacterium Gr01-1014_7]|nr:MAG: hypothetical protein G01um10147_715 [Microgenomates group bacterium Gr01-1014_7]